MEIFSKDPRYRFYKERFMESNPKQERQIIIHSCLLLSVTILKFWCCMLSLIISHNNLVTFKYNTSNNDNDMLIECINELKTVWVKYASSILFVSSLFQIIFIIIIVMVSFYKVIIKQEIRLKKYLVIFFKITTLFNFINTFPVFSYISYAKNIIDNCSEYIDIMDDFVYNNDHLNNILLLGLSVFIVIDGTIIFIYLILYQHIYLYILPKCAVIFSKNIVNPTLNSENTVSEFVFKRRQTIDRIFTPHNTAHFVADNSDDEYNILFGNDDKLANELQQINQNNIYVIDDRSPNNNNNNNDISNDVNDISPLKIDDVITPQSTSINIQNSFVNELPLTKLVSTPL